MIQGTTPQTRPGGPLVAHSWQVPGYWIQQSFSPRAQAKRSLKQRVMRDLPPARRPWSLRARSGGTPAAPRCPGPACLQNSDRLVYQHAEQARKHEGCSGQQILLKARLIGGQTSQETPGMSCVRPSPQQGVCQNPPPDTASGRASGSAPKTAAACARSAARPSAQQKRSSAPSRGSDTFILRA